MRISEILMIKFPLVSFQRDIIIQDDGQGAYIKQWNLPDPRPTDAQLAQWAIDLQPQFDLQQEDIRLVGLNKDVMKQLIDVDMKSIRALRENAVVQIQNLETQAIALRAKLVK